MDNDRTGTEAKTVITAILEKLVSYPQFSSDESIAKHKAEILDYFENNISNLLESDVDRDYSYVEGLLRRIFERLTELGVEDKITFFEEYDIKASRGQSAANSEISISSLLRLPRDLTFYHIYNQLEASIENLKSEI